jgi:heme-degrading monooxygenase HmoA
MIPEVPVTQLLTVLPPPEAIATLGAIQGVRLAPTVLNAQEGPEGHRGPEAAQALLLLQATFSHEERAHAFWRAAAALMEHLATAPGFIRRYSFADGPTITLLALWRTVADANAFFASDEHQAAVRDLYRQRWQYSHFAALFETASHRDRVIFCDHCDGITTMPASECCGCGAALIDVHRTRAPERGQS